MPLWRCIPCLLKHMQRRRPWRESCSSEETTVAAQEMHFYYWNYQRHGFDMDIKKCMYHTPTLMHLANIISWKHYHIPIFKNTYNVTSEIMHRNKKTFYVRTQYKYSKGLSFTEPYQGILQEHHSEETKTNITKEDKNLPLRWYDLSVFSNSNKTSSKALPDWQRDQVNNSTLPSLQAFLLFF